MKLKTIALCAFLFSSYVNATEFNLDNKGTIKFPDNYKVQDLKGSFSRASRLLHASNGTCTIQLQNSGEKVDDKTFLDFYADKDNYKKLASAAIIGSRKDSFSEPEQLKVAGYHAFTTEAKDLVLTYNHKKYKLPTAIITVNTPLGELHTIAMTNKADSLEECKKDAVSALNTLKLK